MSKLLVDSEEVNIVMILMRKLLLFHFGFLLMALCYWFNVAANWSILDVPWNMNLALLSYYLAILRV